MKLTSVEGTPKLSERRWMAQLKQKQKVGAVLVVGGGVVGIQAALDLADSGYYVYLIEKSPAIGGKMAQLDKTFPTNDCSMCTLSPKLVQCGRHSNIEILTLSEVKEITGEEGNFQVKVGNGLGDSLQFLPRRWNEKLEGNVILNPLAF